MSLKNWVSGNKCGRSLAVLLVLLSFAASASKSESLLPPPPLNVQALAGAGLEMASLKGDFGSLQGIQLTVEKNSLLLSIERMALTANSPLSSWRSLRLRCCSWQQQQSGLACQSARLLATNAALGLLRFSGALQWNRDGNLRLQGQLTADQVPGSVALNAHLNQNAQLNLQLSKVNLAKLSQLLKKAELLPESFRVYSISKGVVEGNLKLSAALDNSRQPLSLNWQLQLDQLALANADSTIATDQFSVRSKGQLRQQRSGQADFEAEAILVNGYAGVDPVFINFAESPLLLEARGTVDQQSLQVEHWALGQSRWLAALGKLRYHWQDGLQSAYLRLTRADLAKLFPTYAQPLLLSTPLAEAEMAGQLTGQLRWRRAKLQSASLKLNSVALDDPAGRYSVAEVNGEIHLDNRAQPRPSSLRWQAANAFRIPVGATKLEFALQPEQVRLLKPTSIPLLDGALAIQAGAFYWGDQAGLSAEKRGDKAAELSAELVAELNPISWKSLTTALGWPEFGGTLGGQLPKLRYQDGLWQVDGALRAQLFDGELAIRDLQLESLLGALPIVRANVQLQGLDLQKVTQAFDFGEITGRMNASVSNLVLAGWQPVAFDAKLRSDGGGTLSQRALDTISDIGGGGGAAGRLFLGVFKNFPYRQIQWRCKLVQNVCLTGGDTRAGGNGYYLVEGRSLPRVDVIGYSTRVNWPTLVGQIKEAIERGVGQ